MARKTLPEVEVEESGDGLTYMRRADLTVLLCDDGRISLLWGRRYPRDTIRGQYTFSGGWSFERRKDAEHEEEFTPIVTPRRSVGAAA